MSCVESEGYLEGQPLPGPCVCGSFSAPGCPFLYYVPLGH